MQDVPGDRSEGIDDLYVDSDRRPGDGESRHPGATRARQEKTRRRRDRKRGPTPFAVLDDHLVEGAIERLGNHALQKLAAVSAGRYRRDERTGQRAVPGGDVVYETDHVWSPGWREPYGWRPCRSIC